MRRGWWPVIASVVLLYPAVLGGVLLASGPLADGDEAWVLRGRVLAVEGMPVADRYEPLPVAEVEVLEVKRPGTGDRPAGTIEVAVPEWANGAPQVRPGRTLHMAVLVHEMHDPETMEETFQGYHLEDVRGGCCWASRIGQVGDMWPLAVLGVLTVGAVAWAAWTQPMRPWPVAVSVATGVCVALLAGAWSNQGFEIIRSDGEENHDVGALAIVLALAAVAGWAAQAIWARRPLAWAFALGWALAYPMAASIGERNPDFGLAAAALGLPPLAVAMGQREGRAVWMARIGALLLSVPLVLLAGGAAMSPYRPEPVVSFVLVIVLAGAYVAPLIDGSGAWRPAVEPTRR